MRINRSRAAHYERTLARARACFLELRGPSEVPVRAAEIAARPSKIWNGVPVFELYCEGPFGRGPHVQWVPEYVLWGLISLEHFLCPYHR